MTRIRVFQPITRLAMILAIALAISGIAIALTPGTQHHDAVSAASRANRAG